MLISIPRFRSPRLDFETHLKYANLIAGLSANVKIVSSLAPKLPKLELPKLKDKIQLIELTKLSLDQEYNIVTIDKDYSMASVHWLPIKTYYLVYHQLCVIDCLLSGKLSSLSAGHHECVNGFSKMLKNADIQFSSPLLNGVYDETILSFTTKSGEHLKSSVADDIVYQLVMKKTATSKVDTYKIVQKLSGRKPKDKVKIANFQRNMAVSIFDFFHIMRLRMNYRNLNFVDNVRASDAKEYFEQYYACADHFYECFKAYTTELAKNCP